MIDLLRHGGRIDLDNFLPIVNERFPIMAAAVVALYAAAFLYHYYREQRERWEEFVLWPLVGIANALTVTALSLELVSYFDSRASAADPAGLHHHIARRATEAKLLSLTAMWSIYGFILAAVGLWRRWAPVRWAGLALLGLTILKLMTIDTMAVELARMGFPPVLNFQFMTCALLVVVLAVLAWRFRTRAQDLIGYESRAFVGLVVAANFVALWTLNQEIINYFDGRAVRYDEYDLLPPQFHYAQVAMNAKYLSMTYLWAIYGTLVIAVGLWRRLPPVRWAGLAILALAALKLLAFDTFMVELVHYGFIPFLNLHFLAFGLVIALMLGSAWWHRRVRPEPSRFETYVIPGLLVGANVVALWGLTLEAVHYFDARADRLGADAFGAQQLSLTVLWAVYAVGIIGVGIARQSSRIRLAGMALLAVPLIKLFGFDVFLLEREYRVAAFVTLGVLMLGTGLAYQRYSQAVRGFLFGQRT